MRIVTRGDSVLWYVERFWWLARAVRFMGGWAAPRAGGLSEGRLAPGEG